MFGADSVGQFAENMKKAAKGETGGGDRVLDVEEDDCCATVTFGVFDLAFRGCLWF